MALFLLLWWTRVVACGSQERTPHFFRKQGRRQLSPASTLVQTIAQVPYQAYPWASPESFTSVVAVTQLSDRVGPGGSPRSPQPCVWLPQAGPWSARGTGDSQLMGGWALSGAWLKFRLSSSFFFSQQSAGFLSSAPLREERQVSVSRSAPAVLEPGLRRRFALRETFPPGRQVPMWEKSLGSTSGLG